MPPSQNPGNPTKARRVIVVAPSMPPVHGQAMVSRRVAEMVEERGHQVAWVSRNTPTLGHGTRYRAAVAARVIRAFGVSLRLRGGPEKTVYVGSSGGMGVIAEGLVVGLIKRRRDRLIVHHHSFAYLNHRSLAWQILARTVYRTASHVLLCDCMARRFATTYGVADDQINVVGNAAFVDPPECGSKRSLTDKRIRLGHLSNLSLDKGLDVVLAALEIEDSEVLLSVYGSPIGKLEADMLQAARERYGERFHVVTPTDRAGVWEYLSSINLFLFPSSYVNEAAPLVVLEALAIGVPVFVSDVGCLNDMLYPHLSEHVTSMPNWEVGLRPILERAKAEPHRTEMLAATQRQWLHLLDISRTQIEGLLRDITCE